MNSFHKKCLCAMLKIILDCFEQYNIFYFIDGGTLLGAIRDGGIIYHDDDIDIGVMDMQFDKLEPVLDEIDGEEVFVDDKIFNMHIQMKTGILKFYLPQFAEIYKSDLEIPCIDVFKWTLEDGKIQLLPKEFRDQFINCYYEYNEMFPCKIYKLNEIKVKGAGDPYPYLTRYYDEDCLKVKKKYLRNNLGFKNDFVIVE